jgi:biopolymer transport protein ExbD
MRNIAIIIGFLLLIISCTKENNKIKGTWINSDFTSPIILAFTDSLWVDYLFGSDSLPYYIKDDSIFVHGLFNPELIGFSYRISGDTLWTSFPGDLQTNETKYLKSKSHHYFNDIKTSLGIDIELPVGYSNLVGLRNGNSIYLPSQSSNNGIYKIFLNNERLPLDTLLHEKIFDLREHNEHINHNLVGLYIDSNIKYATVKLLKNELRKAGYFKVAYLSDPISEKHYVSNTGIIRKLPPIFENENYFVNPEIRKIVDNRRPPNPPKEHFNEPDYRKPNVCKIEIIDNQIFLNELKFDSDSFYKIIRNNNPIVIYLSIDSESNYQTYYSFISKYDSLCKMKKNEKSIEIYQKEFDKLIDVDKIKFINGNTKCGLREN